VTGPMSQAVANSTLAVSLADARKRFIAANPRSLAVHAEATAVMPGGNTRSTLFYAPFPLTMVRGEGCRLWDADGHEYVDLLGEYTAGIYGHNSAIIRSAIDRALDTGWNLGGHGLMEAQLARLICERFPGIDLIRFTNSGTEANLMALGTAAAVTRRRGVLVFDGAYHGGVLYFRDGGIPTNVPYGWILGPYNDPENAVALVRRNAAQLAAILVEPMLGGGGCIPADPWFLRSLRKAADEAGALLIFDEVMTSRMSGGGQQKRIGVRPDLTTLGKYIGGGMSFGAFGGRAEIMERYDPRRPDAIAHSGTFNNNVLTMAAGVAGLTHLFTSTVADALFARGEALRGRLNALSHGFAMRWSGLGSLMTVHFQANEPLRFADLVPDSGAKELFFFEMLRHGFYLARRGMIALSLEVGDRECDAFCAAVEDFVACHQSSLSRT
jgi:glutamate-1-semialdehyde 2,1-aminomutase